MRINAQVTLTQVPGGQTVETLAQIVEASPPFPTRPNQSGLMPLYQFLAVLPAALTYPDGAPIGVNDQIDWEGGTETLAAVRPARQAPYCIRVYFRRVQT